MRGCAGRRTGGYSGRHGREFVPSKSGEALLGAKRKRAWRLDGLGGTYVQLLIVVRCQLIPILEVELHLPGRKRSKSMSLGPFAS